MSLRLLCDYIVPCCLCEDPLEHVMIHRDDETGSESAQRVRLPHDCIEKWKTVAEGRR